MTSRKTRMITILPDVTLVPGRLYAIGEVAELLDVTLRAVRFYCEKKLIVDRIKTSERYFDVHNVLRLSLVLQGKLLGFSLRDISTLIVDHSNAFGGPVLVVPERVITKEIEALRQRNELMLAIISKSMLNKPKRQSPSPELRRRALPLVS